jgi:hypothetical protein
MIKMDSPSRKPPAARRVAALAALSLAVAAPIFSASAASAKPKAAGKVTSGPHPGPFRLKWGKSPADARSMLGGKVEFASEQPADEAPYTTIDQRYTGRFGGLPTKEIRLRFHEGEFFYLSVQLDVAGPGASGTASKVWGKVVRKMREAYGPPLRVNEPPTLSSKQAVLDHVLPEPDRESGMPPLWNEQTRQSDLVLHRLRDEEIRLGLWDPFAAWRFENQVVVQVFMHSTLGEDGKPTPLVPVWIFAKEDRFKKWKAAVQRSTIIEPRDF